MAKPLIILPWLGLVTLPWLMPHGSPATTARMLQGACFRAFQLCDEWPSPECASVMTFFLISSVESKVPYLDQSKQSREANCLQFSRFFQTFRNFSNFFTRFLNFSRLFTTFHNFSLLFATFQNCSQLFIVFPTFSLIFSISFRFSQLFVTSQPFRNLS